MPTYEYECPKCDVFEVIQRMVEPPLKKCPSCKSKVRRLIGLGGGVIYKGSGFYTTEYRSEEYKKRESEEKSGGSSSASKEPAKTESSGSHKSSCGCCKKSTCGSCKK